jgi:signal transduction histidine kinase
LVEIAVVVEDQVQSPSSARAASAAPSQDDVGTAREVTAFPTSDVPAGNTARGRGARTALAAALGLALAAGAYHASFAVVAGRGGELRENAGALELAGFALLACAFVFVATLRSARRARRDAERLAQREHALRVAGDRALAGLSAAAIAHDANNVLCALGAEIELQRAQPDRDREARIDGCIARLTALNRRLLCMARPGERAELAPIDLAGVVSSAVASWRSHPLLRDCRVTLGGLPTLPIHSDASLWHQIVSNLLINAGEATGGRGAIEVRLERRDRDLALEVHDDGPGVPPARRAGLFEALSSTKPSGSGLGLFSVKSCARLLGGGVEVGDSPLGGALFRVSLRSPSV